LPPVLLDVLERLAVHARRALVGLAAVVGEVRHVRAVHLRTARRTGRPAIPSLCHATPPATSERFGEVLGSSANLLVLRRFLRWPSTEAPSLRRRYPAS